MVKTQKKTKTTTKYAPVQENREIFVLIRTVKSKKHLFVLRSTITSTKKIEKLEPEDNVSFGPRTGRLQAVVLAIDNFGCLRK